MKTTFLETIRNGGRSDGMSNRTGPAHTLEHSNCVVSKLVNSCKNVLNHLSAVMDSEVSNYAGIETLQDTCVLQKAMLSDVLQFDQIEMSGTIICATIYGAILQIFFVSSKLWYSIYKGEEMI